MSNPGEAFISDSPISNDGIPQANSVASLTFRTSPFASLQTLPFSRHRIWVSWDGYVAGVGVILAGWYTETARIEELLALGDLSRLGTKIAPEPGTTHTFAHPQPDVSVAYHRDRDERMKSARRYANVEAYRRDGKGDFGADYLYLFTNGRWYVYGVADEDWIELKVTVNREKNF